MMLTIKVISSHHQSLEVNGEDDNHRLVILNGGVITRLTVS